MSREVTWLGIASIEAIFAFEAVNGTGAGLVRLSPDHSGIMRAWLVPTTLQLLRDQEERLGAYRPGGAAYSRNFGGNNWADMRCKDVVYADREPAVMVIGGAQAGLAIAARINQLGVNMLVVERWPQIGDNWRRRYHLLALHKSTYMNHLFYMDFPPTWQLYIPKDMLSNWFEFHAHAMEINCWTGTESVAGICNEAGGQWVATVRFENGSDWVMHPHHLVLPNGGTYPMVPDLPGLAEFAGAIMHAKEFDRGVDWMGKKAPVLGTGGSANDIALDLHSNGAKTTLIQRGSTTVVSIDPSARLNEAVWDEGEPLEDSGLIVASAPPALIIKGYQAATKCMPDLDREMIAGFEGIGFKHDVDEDETGHQAKYFRRGGGYNLDARRSALMIKGESGLLQYDRNERFVADSARLIDGTTVMADLIVLATDYFPHKELVQHTLGQEIVDRVGPVLGIDDEGELSNMFNGTPQPGLWFIAGRLPQCCINSKYRAPQIKATELCTLDSLK